jgi:hypothetical protein
MELDFDASKFWRHLKVDNLSEDLNLTWGFSMSAYRSLSSDSPALFSHKHIRRHYDISI